MNGALMIRLGRVLSLAMILLVWAAIPVMAQEVPANAEEVGGVPTALMMWSTIVGFFGSLVISAINRQRWTSELKALSTFVWCIVGALGTAYYSGDLTKFADVSTAALFVIFSAIGSYQLLWKPSGIAGKVESATG